MTLGLKYDIFFGGGGGGGTGGIVTSMFFFSQVLVCSCSSVCTRKSVSVCQWPVCAPDNL